MTLKTFAAKHRLKIKLDECGDAIVQGKHGTLYEYSDELIGLSFMPPTVHGRRWGAAQREMAAVGMTITQNGGAEGAASFDGHDMVQAKLAIRLVKARVKRVLDEKERETLANRLALARQVKSATEKGLHSR